MRRVTMMGLGLALNAGWVLPVAAQQPGAGAVSWSVPTLSAPAPIAPEEYQTRRAALAASMEDGVLIVFGAEEPAADYLAFDQSVGFRYLTGLTEPGAALLIEKSRGEVSEQLFVLPRDPSREVWDGVRAGAEGARAATGIFTRTTRSLAPALDSIVGRSPRIYSLSRVPEAPGPLDVLTAEQQIIARLKARYPRVELQSLEPILLRTRAAKSGAELDRIRRAVYITALAHRAAMRTLEPGMNEFEIQGLVEYTFRRNGAERPGFASIVGSGPNSTTLHYNANDRFIQAGETVVIDIGAAYDGYTADVTRTLPASGRFTPEQRAIYEIVLAAQKAAEARVRPGASMGEANQEANRVIAEGLARLGLIESASATYDCSGGRCPQYRLFFMHGLGHGIGLDVHDPDVYEFGAFRVGSAFTIEPGIYIRADALDHLDDTPANRATIARLRPTLQRYQNIGVRIEDDYIVTASAYDRVSSGAPREIAEVEEMMRQPPITTTERREEVVDWYRSLRTR